MRHWHALAALGVASLTGGSAAQESPSEFALEGVPYIGNDWQAHLDGPQDLMFASAMASVTKFLGTAPPDAYRFFMGVCGVAQQQLWHPTEWRTAFDDVWRLSDDPTESVRRTFEAAGYEYRLLGNQAVRDARGLPADYPEYVIPDVLKQQVCESLRSGVPVIAFGLKSGAAVIAGYEENGDVLLGWAMLENEGASERGLENYFRLRQWTDETQGVALIGQRVEPPSTDESCQRALLWALQNGRRARIGEYLSGLSALAAWADALVREPFPDPADLATLRRQHVSHFMTSLNVAEGRAFAYAMTDPVEQAHPEVAEDVGVTIQCHRLMHDLVWRLWQTKEPGTEEEQLRRFADPAVRQELRRIVLLERDADAHAFAHIDHMLRTLGVDPKEIPEPSADERDIVARADAREQASGGDRSALEHQEVNLWVGGVPRIAWHQGKDCTFIGALEAAMAPTFRPCEYSDLMGYSGLAFRTRWFRNPEGVATPYGTLRWHPVSPHGEGPDEVAAISRATGWDLRRVDFAEDDHLARMKAITDFVLSINEALPVVIGYNTDLAVAYGYHIHSMSLFLRDYQQPDADDIRVGSEDAKLGPVAVFLGGIGEAPTPADALLDGLAMAVSQGRQARGDGFVYGPDALRAWAGDLAGYDGYSPEEQSLLYQTNWWTLMHLADARRAAVAFLEANTELLPEAARSALAPALECYSQEAELLDGFVTANAQFLPWWGGTAGEQDWDEATRQAQSSLLLKTAELEEPALEAVGEALRRAGRAAQ